MAKRIMIIEDDAIELNKLSLMLDLKGFEICPVSRSYKLFTEVTHCMPDLILIDSIFTKFETTLVGRALNAMNSIQNIPLVLIEGKDYEYYTYVYNAPEAPEETIVKTADIYSLIQDIELKLAS